MPDLSRGPMIDLADAGVEPSNTAEAGGQCHIAHPQICLVNELLRKVHLASFCHRARSRAQVLEKQATEVTRANSKTFRERFDATVFQATFADQAQGTRNRIWSSHPCWSSGRAFGPATQARAEPRFSSRGSSRKVTNIFLLRRRRWADRSAIDTAREHGDEELAVEARIARHPGSRTYLPIQFHLCLKLIA